MVYKNLEECLNDLECNGMLLRIKDEVDPLLEMAAIHLEVHSAGGPAILFERVKGSPFRAASNIFGTMERCRFMFRDTLPYIEKLVALKQDPLSVLKNPIAGASSLLASYKALPKEEKFPSGFMETNISSLPQIQCWPMDGGAFITLPQVYSEDVDNPGIQNSNLGMYRIQLGGNNYIANKEIGLHYQLHRGIGIHQSKALAKGQPLKVSIFVGGPPAHSFAAVMPLPEGLSELMFAGALAGRRFRYSIHQGHVISNDADFVITGEVYPMDVKPEGPFGDHFGYYSLKHDFPLMRVHKVYGKKNAIWPFTVVGRPPQEDTAFGKMIHEMTGRALTKEIPGLHELNAVDAAGVHPLLLAAGSERYTPYSKEKKPQELLTIGNRILGTGQLSLAKYLLIINKGDDPSVSANDIPAFFRHMLERINWSRDLHFYTRFTIDTLDYSGENLNSGSKLMLACSGDKVRELATAIPSAFALPKGYNNPLLPLPGIMIIAAPPYKGPQEVEEFCRQMDASLVNSFPLLVLADDSPFCAASLNNFLWVTFTKSNPSHDVHGIGGFTEHKHWGCTGPLVIDARSKPHHAPPLEMDEAIMARAKQRLKGLII